MQVLTQSELREWLTCQRRYRWSHLLDNTGYRGSDTPRYFLYGRRFHQAMELLHRHPTEDWDDTFIGGVIEILDLTLTDDEILKADPETEEGRATLRGQVRGYAKHYRQLSEDPYWHLTQSEVRFEVKLPHLGATTYRYGNTWLAGIIDGFAVDSFGLEWLVEHKTSSAIGLNWANQISYDLQASFYLFACDTGSGLPKPSGVLYNVVRKPSIRPRRGETLPEYELRLEQDMLSRPEFYFQREFAVRSSLQRSEFHRVLWNYVADLETRKCSERFLPNLLSCGACQFSEVCALPETLRDQFVRDYFVRNKSKNPELPSRMYPLKLSEGGR